MSKSFNYFRLLGIYRLPQENVIKVRRMRSRRHIVFIELVSMVLLLLILTIIITKKFPGTGPESDRSRVFIPPLFSPLPFLSPPPSPSSPSPPLQLPPLDELSGEVFLCQQCINVLTM